MSDRAALLLKIKKCLAMAKSANEHEAAAALATARRLIDEYGIDQVEVDLLDVGEHRAREGCAWTPTRWESVLARAVSRAIPTERISCGDAGWAFIGITPAPQIAAYAFTVLFRQLKRARSEYISTALTRVATAKRKTARADAFCEGWAVAVHAKIAALYAEPEASAEVRAFIERRYPGASTLKPRLAPQSGRAIERDRNNGWAAGREIDINRGVGGSQPVLELS